MPYETEITFHQGSPREFTYEGVFSTMDEAVEHIQYTVAGNPSTARAWINNHEVRLLGSIVCDGYGHPIAGNPKWEELFNPHYKAARSLEARMREANMALAVEIGGIL